ncbi:MAG: ECF transporter S component [Staphylothermus sp.]|nr:ECF transporter S component [Staphylothermus sp.]
MVMTMFKNRNYNIVDIVVFTVAVYVVTIAIQIYQPATGGYFNLGESIIYLAALLKGPLVAGIAGGVGAALADLSTGYSVFAPGTLVIKFIEGLLAGYLVQKISEWKSKIFATLIGVFYTALLIVFAIHYWAGEIYIGPENFLTISIETPLVNIPLAVWIIIALVLGGLVSYVLIHRYVKELEAVALLVAGLEMVLGYFLYEFFISNPLTGRDPWAAIVELPVNIGQAVIGASIAVPIAAWLRRAGYVRQTSTQS